MIRQRKKIHGSLVILAAIVLGVAIYVWAMLTLPLPATQVTLEAKGGPVATGEAHMPWPQAEQLAVGAVGYGLLAADGDDTSIPIASVAKVITAIAVLKQKPLQAGESGPTLTFTEDDVATYNAEHSTYGSTVYVTAGGKLTQYQTLQGLLLPSGNNLAIKLADWAFGSQDAFMAYANKMVADLGMSKTHMGDASGRSPKTVSTARDLIILGQEALKYPVLVDIISQKQASLPMSGVAYNVNTMLGVADINGIKTGNTGEAGGCFLFSATREVEGQSITLVGAAIGAFDLDQALAAAPKIVNAGYANFNKVTALRDGQTVATVSTPWAASAQIIAKGDLSQMVWKGTPLQFRIDVKPATSGIAGQAKLGDQTSLLEVAQPIPEPSLAWRLMHPHIILQSLFTRAQ